MTSIRAFCRTALILYFLAFPLCVTAYRYDLSVCMMFHNEERFIKEWLEYHRMLGVEHFYLINNRSSDRSMEILRPYILSGLVEVEACPAKFTTGAQWIKAQDKYYTNTVLRVGQETKWLAIIDCDEYLVPTEKDSLVDFLTDYEEFGGIAVNWQMFGTSGIAKIPEDKLLIETLLYRALPSYNEHYTFKTILRPDRVKRMYSPHAALYKKPYFLVDERKMKCGPQSSDGFVHKIRINHYWTGDEEYFQERKLKRPSIGTGGRSRFLTRANQMNEVREDQGPIQRFVPRLREIMGLNVWN